MQNNQQKNNEKQRELQRNQVGFVQMEEEIINTKEVIQVMSLEVI